MKKSLTLFLIILLSMSFSFSIKATSGSSTIPEGALYNYDGTIRSRITYGTYQSVSTIPNQRGDIYFSASQSAYVGVDDTLGRYTSNSVDLHLSFLAAHEITDDDWNNNGISDCSEGTCASGSYTNFGSTTSTFYFQMKRDNGQYVTTNTLITMLNGAHFRMGNTDKATSVAGDINTLISIAQIAVKTVLPEYGTAIALGSTVLKQAVTNSNPTIGSYSQLKIESTTRNGQPALKFITTLIGSAGANVGSSLQLDFSFAGFAKGVYTIETAYVQNVRAWYYISNQLQSTTDLTLSQSFSKFDLIRSSSDINYNDHYARVISLSANENQGSPSGTNLVPTNNGNHWFVVWGAVSPSTGSQFSAQAASPSTNYQFSSWTVDGTAVGYSTSLTYSVSDAYSVVVANYIYAPSGGGGGGGGGGGTCTTICINSAVIQQNSTL